MQSLDYPQLVTAAISIVSLVVATVSLIRTRKVQLQQLRLQQKQEELTRLQLDSYFAERRITLKSELTERAIALKPINSEQQVNNLVLYFPRKLGLGPIALSSPNLELEFDRMSRPIRDYWDSKTAPVEGAAAVRPHALVPVLIHCLGHTRGVAVETTAIYDLYSEYTRMPNGSSSLKFSGFSLHNYWPLSEDPQLEVDRLLEAIESATLGLVSPEHQGAPGAPRSEP